MGKALLEHTQGNQDEPITAFWNQLVLVTFHGLVRAKGGLNVGDTPNTSTCSILGLCGWIATPARIYAVGILSAQGSILSDGNIAAFGLLRVGTIILFIINGINTWIIKIYQQ